MTTNDQLLRQYYNYWHKGWYNRLVRGKLRIRYNYTFNFWSIVI